MSGLNRDDDSRASKIEGAILNGLVTTGQGAVAGRLGVDESTISCWKRDGKIRQIAELLTLCGLKAVPTAHECHAPEYIQALRVLADIGLRYAPEPVE